MTTFPRFDEVLSPTLVRGVGYALLHSLWQGGVLALLLAGALPLLRHRRAEVRYALAAGALAALLLAAGGTFGCYYRNAPPVAAGPAATVFGRGPLAAAGGVGATASAAPLATEVANPLAWWQLAGPAIEHYLPLIVMAWLLGLVVLSGRLAGGLLYAGRLRRTGTQALGPEWQQRLAVLAARAGLRRPVALLESARVAGPLVLGHLRPVILLPLGAVAGLSPSLLEALLAHELAHVVRRDYLLNLGLAVTEVLFFYHPAVWFMAGRLRAERENCCDDQAAALCGGDRLRVARALAALAELTAAAAPALAPRLALAATGGGRGQLLARVRRLVLSRPPAPTLRERLLAGALTLLGLLGLGTGVGLAARPAPAALAQTMPAPADTARRAIPAVPAPPMPDRPQETEKSVRTTAMLASRPHRGRASTIVVEKDKKGRLVNLTVDGQPVETTTSGKKHKLGKVVSTEVVQVPGPAEGPERHSLKFDFSTGELTSRAQRKLAKALRNPSLNEEQRQQMQREMAKLQKRMQTYQAEMSQQRQHFQFDFNRDSTRQSVRRFLRFDRSRQIFNGATAAPAEASARLAERDAEQAEANGQLAEVDTRRAELRARIDAAAAELRSLERGAGQVPQMSVPPRAPMAQTGPPSPQAPPPPPPAPKTAELRAALRQDGLIGKDERSFTLSLNDKGGSVNGKSLTPAQVARYRQLLGQPVSGQGSSSSFSITVNEN